MYSTANHLFSCRQHWAAR